MSDMLIVAAISSGGTEAVAITALILMFRSFGSLLRRLDAISSDIKSLLRVG